MRAASVLGRTEIYTDPWFGENSFFRSFEQPGLGQCRAVASFATWRGHDVQYGAPAPRIGEHAREILAAVGVTPDRLQELVSNGAAHVLADR